MLQRVFTRTSRAMAITETIFATTTDPSDDPVAEYCDFSGIPFTRGNLYDVLDRYYQAAKEAKAEHVVRITADCPVIDPTLIDDVVNTLLEGEYDFVCNRLPPPWHRTYPIGLDVEACSFKVLEKAWNETKEPQHREHVMPYFYEGVELTTINDQLQTGISLRGFRMALLNHTPDFGTLRWTVDTAEDLTFIREVFARLAGRSEFTWYDVLEIVQQEPELAKINADVRHKSMTDVDERNRTA